MRVPEELPSTSDHSNKLKAVALNSGRKVGGSTTSEGIWRGHRPTEGSKKAVRSKSNVAEGMFDA